MLFDAHTHMNAPDFDEDRDEVIERARRAGVSGMVFNGYDEASLSVTKNLTRDHPDILATYGVEADNAKDYDEKTEKKLLEALDDPKVVAVGETGLDYHWNESPHDVQERVFRRHLAIAREGHLPIVVHNREANEDTYRILKDERVWEIGGIMHNFGDDSEWAKKFTDLGMTLSFSGVATFKKTKAVRKAAVEAPRDQIVIETDAPYLTPEPKRGQRNESNNIRYTCNRLADELGMSYENFAALTYQNACRVYHIQWVDGEGFVKA